MCDYYNKPQKPLTSLTELLDKNFIRKLPTFHYNFEMDKWQVLEPEKDVIIWGGTLKLITFNVWRDFQYNFENRLAKIIKILEKHEPDFICLQEVTYKFLFGLYANSFIRENYYFSNNLGDGYDILMLSKYNSRFYQVALHTEQKKTMIFTEVFLKEKNVIHPILIGNVQLEEGRTNSYERKEQLNTAFLFLNKANYSFLMGDYGYDSEWPNEYSTSDKRWTNAWDIWKEKKSLPREAGITYPINPRDSNHTSDANFDKVLYKNPKKFTLQVFKLLGKEEIEVRETGETTEGEPLRYPSPHFGIYTKWKINKDVEDEDYY